jgi:hypothetical protein
MSSHGGTYTNNLQTIFLNPIYDIHSMPAAYANLGIIRFVTPAHCRAQATQAQPGWTTCQGRPC